jgi:hypothetical protein
MNGRIGGGSEPGELAWKMSQRRTQCDESIEWFPPSMMIERELKVLEIVEKRECSILGFKDIRNCCVV